MTTTPEQSAAARDRALYMQLAGETYSQPADLRDALFKQRVESQLAELEKQALSQKESLERLVAERDKALRWGVLALGTAVMGMTTWIVNLFTAGHIK